MAKQKNIFFECALSRVLVFLFFDQFRCQSSLAECLGSPLATRKSVLCEIETFTFTFHAILSLAVATPLLQRWRCFCWARTREIHAECVRLSNKWLLPFFMLLSYLTTTTAGCFRVHSTNCRKGSCSHIDGRPLPKKVKQRPCCTIHNVHRLISSKLSISMEFDVSAHD